MVPIDNGYRAALDIPNVFTGTAGVSGRQLAFIPNGRGRPEQARTGRLDGMAVRLSIIRIGKGPLYSATYEYVEPTQP